MAKLTVEFPDRLNATLEALSEKQDNMPKAQLIRRAIALLKFVEDEKEKNHRLVIADEDGKIIKEIVTGT